jgi:putative MATE family efflux protein
MTRDMTTGSPLKQILSFCVPLLFGNLFQQFYNMADSIIVGKFLGVNAFAAVGATGSINFFIVGFALGLCSGIAIPISQDFGAGDYESMRRCTAHCVYLCIGITVFLTTAMYFGTYPLLELLQTPPDIIDEAFSYIFTIFMGISATILYNMTAAVLRAIGDSRTPLYFLILASMVNIGLDYLFVGVWHFGVAGAAYATVIAQAISGLLCLATILKRYALLRLEKRHWHFSFECALRELGIGVPMGLQFSITAIGSITLQSAVNTLGSGVVAAISAAAKVQNIIVSPMESVGAAMATYCGQNLGAGKIDRVRLGIRQMTAITALYALVGFVIAKFAGTTVALLFIDAQQTAILGRIGQFLYCNALAYIPLSLIFVYRNSLQGLGFSNAAMLAGLAELIGRVIIAFCFVGSYGFDAVCFANPLAWIFADLLLLPLYAVAIRRLTRTRQQR